MTMRSPVPLLALGLLVLCVPPRSRAEELTGEQVARIQVDEETELARIRAEYGDRLPWELDTEQRSALIREEQAASRRVLERHGVDLKEFVLFTSRLTRAQQEQIDLTRKALEEERARPPPEPQPAGEAPEVISGFSEENPLELYRDPNVPVIEGTRR